MSINIGSGRGHSKTVVNIKSDSDSKLSVKIGGAEDFAQLNVNITEAASALIFEQISLLQKQLKDFEEARVPAASDDAVTRHAKILVDTANKVLREKRWYSVSTEGLLDAARTVGKLASPLVATATKIVGLIEELRS